MNHDELEEDAFLKGLLHAVGTVPELPDQFTKQVMQAVTAEATQQAWLHAPLISRKAWRTIALLVSLLLLTNVLLLLPAARWPKHVGWPFANFYPASPLLHSGQWNGPTLTLSYQVLASGLICLTCLLLDHWYGGLWQRRLSAKR